MAPSDPTHIPWGPAPPKQEAGVGARPSGTVHGGVDLLLKLPEIPETIGVPLSRREASALRQAIKQAMR
ncbi:MAG: hypothetical protein JWN10_1666 [Solirubrobacterales bacterium]|nr:hypothetical protein [Solirubrobacterales bacterium]